MLELCCISILCCMNEASKIEWRYEMHVCFYLNLMARLVRVCVRAPVVFWMTFWITLDRRHKTNTHAYTHRANTFLKCKQFTICKDKYTSPIQTGMIHETHNYSELLPHISEMYNLMMIMMLTKQIVKLPQNRLEYFLLWNKHFPVEHSEPHEWKNAFVQRAVCGRGYTKRKIFTKIENNL